MKVYIDTLNDDFLILDQNHRTIEDCFESYEEAKQYAIDCGYEIMED